MKPAPDDSTLIEEFHYPRLGPGMMWERVQGKIESRGGVVQLNADVVRLRRAGRRDRRVVVSTGGRRGVMRGDHVLSSMPLTELIASSTRPPPPEVLAAAGVSATATS